MQCEKSCGAVLFTRIDDEVRYVILHSIGGSYGFPKGHAESGETEQDTALREIFEEVGVHPMLIDGFRAETAYPLPRRPGTVKAVVLFLAEYAPQPLQPQPEEVDEIHLLRYEDALHLLSFADFKRILTKANNFLLQHYQ